MQPTFKCSIIVVGIWFLFKTELCVLGKLDYSLRSDEVQALEELKPLVFKHLTNEYMKDDHYLVRFLRAKKLSVKDANDMIIRSLEWRKQNKIDGILEETLEVENYFPFLVTRDREGRPVGTTSVDQFELRRYMIAGRYNEILRLAYKLMEVATQEMRRASQTAGQNITQGVCVWDTSGFRVGEHACLQYQSSMLFPMVPFMFYLHLVALTTLHDTYGLGRIYRPWKYKRPVTYTQIGLRFYFHMIGVYENYYPQIGNKLIAVNAPRLFVVAWELLKPVIPEFTWNSVNIYGFNKEEWRKTILELIPNDQLPEFLGGTHSWTPGTHQYN